MVLGPAISSPFNSVKLHRISAKVIEKEAEVVVGISSLKTDIIVPSGSSSTKGDPIHYSFLSISRTMDPVGDKSKLIKSCNSPGLSGFVQLLKRG